MARHDPGPRRSDSVDSYLRGTRVIAAVALLALVGGVASDGLSGRFWGRHALLAGLVASVIVVMLSVALVNEARERRSRRRWSVLAQYVMLEFVLNARLVWTGTLELARLGEIDDEQLADRLVAFAQLAEELDRGTLQLALHIVPLEWWAARLRTTAPISSVVPEAGFAEPPVA